MSGKTILACLLVQLCCSCAGCTFMSAEILAENGKLALKAPPHTGRSLMRIVPVALVSGRLKLQPTPKDA